MGEVDEGFAEAIGERSPGKAGDLAFPWMLLSASI